jgi:hypothetical protein
MFFMVYDFIHCSGHCSPAKSADIIILVAVINDDQGIIACFDIENIRGVYFSTVETYNRIAGFNQRITLCPENRLLYTGTEKHANENV